MMIHRRMYISMLRDDCDDNDHDGDDDDPPGNVHFHVESQQPVADLLLGPHLHGVVCPVEDHEKAEEDNVDGDDHDDISTGLFVLWIVRIKTTRIKMKRTGILIISTGLFRLQMVMKKTTRIKLKRTIKMRCDDDNDISIGCLSLGGWG